MKKIGKWVVIFTCLYALIFTFSTPVFSQDENALGGEEIAGKISFIDSENMKIVVSQTPAGEKQLFQDKVIYLDAATFVERDSEKISILDLKPGEAIKAQCEPDADGRALATSISVVNKSLLGEEE